MNAYKNITAICNSKNKDKEPIKGTQKVTSHNALSAVIDSINSDINNGDYGLIDRFMVIRNNELLADFKYDQDYETIVQKYDTTNLMDVNGLWYEQHLSLWFNL